MTLARKIKTAMLSTAVLGALLSASLLLIDNRAFMERAWAGKLEWSDVPGFAMQGGLSAYWAVIDKSGKSEAQAAARGYLPITVTNVFVDYAGKQKQNINNWIAQHPNNPWLKPDYFEHILRRNTANARRTGAFIGDIEFNFEQDAAKAWADPKVRAASGASTFGAFEEAYFREWASWFALACKWAKEERPGDITGLYGLQPFHRDYYGFVGKDANHIDGAHATDDRMWRYVEPYVDAYVSSIYVFFAKPDSVYYMAANVEENFLRSRKSGDKPVFAFVWLRYHTSNRLEGNREVDPYLAEAMAIVPYFSGAKATVLWGYEPQIGPDDGRPYQRLPEYTAALKRVGDLSALIGRGKLVLDRPAHLDWNAKKPLVRRVELGSAECVVMAINPWQSDEAVSSTEVRCGDTPYTIEMRGRHTTLAHVSARGIELH